MKSYFVPVYLLSVMFAHKMAAQSGCTDPQASNFNTLAITNDGSCVYPTTFYTPVFQADLPGDLKEISGLTYANAAWWAHNDSGNSNDFYSVSTSDGDILKKIALKEADNMDWEDFCADSEALYLGDFGNNTNNRTDLGFYRIPFSAIGNGNNQTVQPEEYTFVSFAYPDQSNFSQQPEDSTVFDCEAAIFTNGQLHLFTKNHRDYTTTHYALNPVNQQVEKLGTLNTQGMVSGASISPDGKMIVLTGYNLVGLPTVFCWMLWDWPSGTNDFFAGNKRKIELGSALLVGQVESIGFLTNRTGFIANERTSFNGITLVNESVRRFDFSNYAPETTDTYAPEVEEPQITLSPNPATGHFTLDWGIHRPEKISVVNVVGQVFQMPVESILPITLPSGTYWLRAQFKGGYEVTRLFMVI